MDKCHQDARLYYNTPEWLPGFFHTQDVVYVGENICIELRMWVDGTGRHDWDQVRHHRNSWLESKVVHVSEGDWEEPLVYCLRPELLEVDVALQTLRYKALLVRV